MKVDLSPNLLLNQIIPLCKFTSQFVNANTSKFVYFYKN